MRAMSTQMGSTAGNNGRTEGMPEVQVSLLEHAAPTEEITGTADGDYPQDNGAVNGVTCTETARKWVTYTMDVWIEPSSRTARMISMTPPVSCDPPSFPTLTA
jgi:hypothetical protein